MIFKNKKLSVLPCFIFLLLSVRITNAKEYLANPIFSAPHGFYNEPFALSITAASKSDTIKHTIDGSDPFGSATARKSLFSTTIHVDPADTNGRYLAPGFIVRAVALRDTMSSKTITHTFMFLNHISELSPDELEPGAGWPKQDKTSGKQAMDYGLDPDVVNDFRYKDQLIDALTSIPTMSLVTDLDNLFNNRNGIYLNAMQRGKEWERPGSLELIYPDRQEGFQVNCGIRIRGGYSRNSNCPKHAFRIFFREEYGDAKLDYPLFGDEGVNEYDKIDLRTSMNYSWSYQGGDTGAWNTMNRDVFSRDIQRDMGQPYTRSRYYHLYVNGVYWGLFQTQERPEARFAASYFGGSKDDYDVVKVDVTGGRYDIEVTDGTIDAWEEVWNICREGFASNEKYFQLQGMDSNGNRVLNSKCLVNIDNLIDYMMIIFYAGNFDAPVSKFLQHKVPNNFYAIYNHNRQDGFIFFAHDAEHTLLTEPISPCEGIEEDRVNIGTRTDGLQMIVTSFNKFHPQWLHYKLTENSEYRMRFADHVYSQFFNEGVFRPKYCMDTFMKRAEEIDEAIIAESARWGDAKIRKPRTKDDDWLPAVDDIVDNFFPVRTDIVLGQLVRGHLYPTIDPPIFLSDGVEVTVAAMEIPADVSFEMVNPNKTGQIYYTLDGSDPRLVGGAVSGLAIADTDRVEFNVGSTLIIQARVQDGDTWSALHKVVVTKTQPLYQLKVTEIHYHPLDEGDIDGREFEFLEIKNCGRASLNLTMLHFTAGVEFTFANHTIQAGQFIVLASNAAAFEQRYGFAPFGEYLGQLDNAGERLTLVNAVGDTIFSIRYNDKLPWPTTPDTDGHSLVSHGYEPNEDPNLPSSWRGSEYVHGSPGADDISSDVSAAQTVAPLSYELKQNYPNPFNAQTTIEYSLPYLAHITLDIYDLLGKKVTTLVDGQKEAGEHRVVWSGQDVAAGVYFYRLKTSSGFMAIQKLVLVK
ncbi:CotH kinase family protein [candidate division KSB1 bacterium]|nr:CotH kinase family protein [candidate division KSB1 bacterium]